MSMEHEHSWMYDGSVYHATNDKCTVRRWCPECGLLQHSNTTGNWYESHVGPTKMFDCYPDGYEESLESEADHDST